MAQNRAANPSLETFEKIWQARQTLLRADRRWEEKPRTPNASNWSNDLSLDPPKQPKASTIIKSYAETLDAIEAAYESALTEAKNIGMTDNSEEQKKIKAIFAELKKATISAFRDAEDPQKGLKAWQDASKKATEALGKIDIPAAGAPAVSATTLAEEKVKAIMKKIEPDQLMQADSIKQAAKTDAERIRTANLKRTEEMAKSTGYIKPGEDLLFHPVWKTEEEKRKEAERKAEQARLAASGAQVVFREGSSSMLEFLADLDLSVDREFHSKKHKGIQLNRKKDGTWTASVNATFWQPGTEKIINAILNQMNLISLAKDGRNLQSVVVTYQLPAGQPYKKRDLKKIEAAFMAAANYKPPLRVQLDPEVIARLKEAANLEFKSSGKSRYWKYINKIIELNDHYNAAPTPTPQTPAAGAPTPVAANAAANQAAAANAAANPPPAAIPQDWAKRAAQQLASTGFDNLTAAQKASLLKSCNNYLSGQDAPHEDLKLDETGLKNIFTNPSTKGDVPYLIEQALKQEYPNGMDGGRAADFSQKYDMELDKIPAVQAQAQASPHPQDEKNPDSNKDFDLNTRIKLLTTGLTDKRNNLSSEDAKKKLDELIAGVKPHEPEGNQFKPN